MAGYFITFFHLIPLSSFWGPLYRSKTMPFIFGILSTLGVIFTFFGIYLHSESPSDKTGNGKTIINRTYSSQNPAFKFRVKFASDSVRIFSDSAYIWKEADWPWSQSSLNRIGDTIRSLLHTMGDERMISLRITGHADDTPRDDGKKEERNNMLASRQQNAVLNMIKGSLTNTEMSRIKFETPNVEWWNVDGYDARNSPGNNSDFRVALIEITY